MPVLTNPFFFESFADRRAFTDRDELLVILRQVMAESGRRLLVFGRRRMGKTSLIKNAAEKGRAIFLYCDISTAANLNEVARNLLDAAPAERPAKLPRVLALAGKYLKSVGVTAGKITLTGELRRHDSEANLEGVLNLLNDHAELNDEIWTVCLDEFQEMRSLGGPRIDWKLRGIMQGHRNLTYIFTGSDHRILEWMTNPTAPFFKQLQQMEVGPIDPDHLAHWIEERAKIGGLAAFPYGKEIVAAAGPCTGDIVRLAKSVFGIAVGKALRGIVQHAFDSIALHELDSEFRSHWRPLPQPQRVVLRAIADGKAPSAADTLREYGLEASSTASTAVQALIDRQILVRTDDGVIFDNPFFRRWVSFNGPRSRP